MTKLRCKLGLHKWEKLTEGKVIVNLLFPFESESPKGCVLCDLGRFDRFCGYGTIRHEFSWSQIKKEQTSKYDA